jgi:hypothetical protein
MSRSSSADFPQFDCAECKADEPEKARTFIRSCPRETLVDQSHFSLDILRCPACGGSYLAIFTELIDWANGDDSQAWLYVPITDTEALALRQAGEEGAERKLHELRLERKHLARIWPRGGAVDCYWVDQAVKMLPHD